MKIVRKTPAIHYTPVKNTIGGDTFEHGGRLYLRRNANVVDANDTKLFYASCLLDGSDITLYGDVPVHIVNGEFKEV